MCAPDRYCHNRKTGSCLVLQDVMAVADLLLRTSSLTSFIGRGSQVKASSAAHLLSLRGALKACERIAGADSLIAASPSAHQAALLRALRRALGPGRREHEWLEMPFIKHHASPALARRLNAAFRPAHPPTWLHNPRMWLNSLDIAACLRQYETRTPDMLFLGVFPIDFASRQKTHAGTHGVGECVSPGMCDFDVVQRCGARGCTQVAAVFNMDRHTQSGSHWTAMYAGLDPSHAPSYGAFYYDSVARPPPREVVALMATIRAQIGAPHKNTPNADDRALFELHHNEVRRQFKNTECGVYAIHFIVQSILRRKSFAEICESAGRDDDMHALRRLFFRSPGSDT